MDGPFENSNMMKPIDLFLLLFFIGDAHLQKHSIFSQYSDYCMEGPGVDKPWIVGTEHRQIQIYEKELSSPKSMKNMMVDHIKRRYFIIDADVAVSRLFFSFDSFGVESSFFV